MHGIGIDARRAQPIVLLRETGEGGRMLPVWVAEMDAAAIVAARDGATSPRPDSHMLIGHVIRAFGHRVTGVVVTELREGVFHAEIVIDDGPRIDCRTSDALALALRLEVGIEVADAVFDQAGVAPDAVHESDEAGSPDTESEVEQFRRMLDDVSPSDFEQD